MAPKPHSPEWYDRLSTMQRGYYYPWRSRVALRNGEDAYMDAVRDYLSPDKDVLDVGCGHGEVALAIAPLCRSVFAYDRVASYIEIAEQARKQARIANVTFVHGDSAAAANAGRVCIPTPDGAFDLIISRRGPLHWIADAPRVARSGAVLLQLNPDEIPAPWDAELPDALRQTPPGHAPQDAAIFAMRPAVDRELVAVGLQMHSCWTFDVPEQFEDAAQLFTRLTFGRSADEAPAFGEVREQLEGIFKRHATGAGLVLRHRRFLWKAVVE